MIHPLLAGNEEVIDEINSGALHDKRVTVHGVYYPATGVMFVDRIGLVESVKRAPRMPPGPCRRQKHGFPPMCSDA